MIYNFNQFKLNELKNVTKDVPDDYNGYYVISYKGEYWLVNEDNIDENITDINNKLGTDEFDLHNLITYIIEEKPYILTAYINDNKIWIDGTTTDFRHSSTSTDLKKIKKELDMDIVLRYTMMPETHNEEEEMKININEIKYYHGTSLNFLNKILKLGIKPTDNTNYLVEHSDKIFLTTNLEKAFSHAKKSAMNNTSYPIIIEVNIPDKSKIGLDYDLAIDIFGVDSDEVKELGFDDVFYKSNSIIQSNKDFTYHDEGFGDLINKIGVISYKGRIPASHIKYIWFDSVNYDGFYLFKEYDDIDGDTSDYESFIWSNMSPVHMWSELTPSELNKRIIRIEEEVDDQFINEEDEDEKE